VGTDVDRTPVRDVDLNDLPPMLERIRAVVCDDDYHLIEALATTVIEMTRELRKTHATLTRVRRLFGLTGNEKTAHIKADVANPASQTAHPAVEPQDAPASDPSDGPAAAESAPEPSAPPTKEKRKGHGRVPASAYRAAQHVTVDHESLRRGDSCPLCTQGRVYELAAPATLVRIVGRAPLGAACFHCKQLRCGACGHVFTARPPPEAQGEKCDESASSMIAVMHYGAGVPFHRLEKLQDNLGTPVPASTQWDVLRDRVDRVEPVYKELKRIAAQAELLHVDDSHMRILSLMGKRRADLLAKGTLEAPERTGLFTTAIVSILASLGVIALFFTGRKHAGENLAELLKQRAPDRPVPLLMSDALSRNVPDGHDVIEINCISHGRRKVVDEVANYPDECLALLERLAAVYKVDHDCKKQGLSDDERLRVHQRLSAPVMGDLQKWMTAQLDEKRIEPHSDLGQAFHYFLKRWDKFTVFLRVPGAPLDNNLCERVLKMAIRLRNVSFFYRSELGARVGDIYMTLIHTAELHHQNPFDYLTALQRHCKAVAEAPGDWLPWNYKATLARRGASPSGGDDTRAAA